MLRKNNNGFILTDALLALTCLIVIVSIILPFIIKLKTEQHHLNLQQEAYYVMQDLQYEANTTGDLKLAIDSINSQYSVTTTPHENHQLICIEWVKENEEIESYCQYTPF